MMSTDVGRKLYQEALRLATTDEPDLGKVVALLRSGIEAGSAEAMYALGTWYYFGKPPVVRKNRASAIKLIERAALANIPDALFDLAIFYEKGEGVVPDPKHAFKLYLRAAIRGQVQSTFEVSRCLFWGIGVSRNKALSEIWLERAKELGADLEWEPVDE
jgi:uncharacterized protein